MGGLKIAGIMHFLFGLASIARSSLGGFLCRVVDYMHITGMKIPNTLACPLSKVTFVCGVLLECLDIILLKMGFLPRRPVFLSSWK